MAYYFLSVAAIVTAALAILLVNYLNTTLAYNSRIKAHQKAQKDGDPSPVPLIPYAIPSLGSTISFSNSKVGAYWTWLATESRRHGLNAISIVLSGKVTHFAFTQDSVLGTFKARQLTRWKLDQQLGTNVLGMSQEDAAKAFPESLDAKTQLTTERIHSNGLLAASAVNSMTDKFMEVYLKRLGQVDTGDDGLEINLYDWMREHLFHASAVALAGDKLLEMFPDMAEDFWHWDHGLIDMLFGKPKFLASQAYASRDKLVEQLQQWLKAGYENQPDDNSDPDWEPNFGARVMRKRHEFYAQQKLSLHGQAGFDLIFIGGILSNAIPATGWMLMHILSPTNPPELLSWVLDELKAAQDPDGSVDIAKLVAQPLLTSMFHEVLRAYTDVLVVRQVEANATIGSHVLNKDEMVMAPSWLSHRNPEYFAKPEAFDPARFLVEDKETGKLVFSTSGLNGKLFPFGGGHYMCPGRTFAKQEVLGAIAVLLLNFDVEFVEFVKPQGKGFVGAGTDGKAFPKLKDGYAGNVVVGLSGDMKVRIGRKEKA